MTYCRIAVAVALILAGIAAGWTGAWKIQATRIDSLNVKNTRLDQEKKECAKANAENNTTITKLQTEIKNTDNLCRNRLKGRDDLVSRLQKIDAIKTPAVAAIHNSVPEKKHEETTRNSSPAVDPILDELNRMFPRKTDRPD